MRLDHVRHEFARLKMSKCKRWAHDNRQDALVRLCDARLRTPQRVTSMTIDEEKARWEVTLMGYDRLLWEGMRVQCISDLVAGPVKFVEDVEDADVCHCDQVLVWLRGGMRRQLYAEAELKRK